MVHKFSKKSCVAYIWFTFHSGSTLLTNGSGASAGASDSIFRFHALSRMRHEGRIDVTVSRGILFVPIDGLFQALRVGWDGMR